MGHIDSTLPFPELSSHLKADHHSPFMQSALKRCLRKHGLLTNLRPASGFYIHANAQLEPRAIPSKYACEDLTTEFVKYWTKLPEMGETELDQVQIDALMRWRGSQTDRREAKEGYAFPLDFYFEIFDDYFFLGSLRQYTKVLWAYNTPANIEWVGHTKTKSSFMTPGPLEVLIQVKRQDHRLRDREIVGECLDTLLHEMIHAFFMIYSVSAMETEGLTGHGEFWVRVATVIAAEANRSFGEVWDQWELGIANARLVERKALTDLRSL